MSAVKTIAEATVSTQGACGCASLGGSGSSLRDQIVVRTLFKMAALLVRCPGLRSLLWHSRSFSVFAAGSSDCFRCETFNFNRFIGLRRKFSATAVKLQILIMIMIMCCY